MGGKALKFPKRKKFVPEDKQDAEEKQEISQEDHEARLRALREMGILK